MVAMGIGKPRRACKPPAPPFLPLSPSFGIENAPLDLSRYLRHPVNMSNMHQHPAAFEAYVAPARATSALWRLLCGLIVLLLIYGVLNGLVLFLYAMRQGTDAAELLLAKLGIASTPDTVLIVLATFLPLGLGIFAATKWLHKRKIGTLFGDGARALRHFAVSAAVWGGLLAVSLALWSLLNDSQTNLPVGLWLRFLPFALLGIAIQTLAEELLFRGYLQQQLAARFSSRWIWAVLPSALFGWLHYAPETLGDGAIFALISATTFGLIAADLTARTGTIGAAWGAHFANNTIAMTVLATQGPLSGLALRVTPYQASEIGLHPLLLVVDLTPMLLGWLLLRRILSPKLTLG